MERVMNGSMGKRNRKIGIVIAAIIILVALFQVFWPLIYPSIVALNPYPTQEYLQITWLFSPNGLSTITIIIGCILIAWVAILDR
jgi:ABC-type phosphate transport system permease subunit